MRKLKKNMEKMPKWVKYTLYAVLGAAGTFLFGLLFGKLIVWLWNWLMPSLFGLRTIRFWEGLGILLLAKILFGFGGSGHSSEGEKKHPKHKRHRHGGEAEQKDWKVWEYYDDWWEEDGKAAFHAYAERMKNEAGEQAPPKADTE